MSKTKKLISIIVLFALVVSTATVNNAKAASLTQVFDRISDSDLGVAANHNIAFTSQIALATNDYFQVDLPSAGGTVSNIGNISCPGTTTPTIVGGTSRRIRCTADTGPVNSGSYTLTINGVTNPGSAGSYLVSVASYNVSGPTIRESADAVIAIIDDVVMQANVPSSLTFAISGLGTSTVVNTATSTGSSTPTLINFGTLTASTTYSSVMAQQLHVTTNAGYGYKVTVEQDQNMVSLSGATIDSFQNNTPPGSPVSWTAPTGTLDATTTYGHMGFTTDDANLSGGNLYGGNKWMGFSGTSTKEVMYHTGPADGSTQDKGSVKIAYRIQITALQEAGDYTNSLTYVATPTY